MELSNARKKELRSIGHHLKPIVMIAEKGVTEAIDNELERALEDHELIKIKLVVGDKSARLAVAQDLCTQVHAELVHSIGSVILILKRSAQPDPKLSNLIRPV